MTTMGLGKLVKNRKIGQKSKNWPKSKNSPKIEKLVKNREIRQKSRN